MWTRARGRDTAGMTCLVILLLMLPLMSRAADHAGKSVPLRADGSVPVWLVAGHFPNAAPLTHGPGCFGYFKDYLVGAGGETAAGGESRPARRLFLGDEQLLDRHLSRLEGK